MNQRTKTALALAPLLLTACTSPDTDSMRAGLGKAGLTAAQAGCYGEALAGALDAKAYNQLAEYLQQGTALEEAITRTRRKFGADVREQIAGAKQTLDACMR